MAGHNSREPQKDVFAPDLCVMFKILSWEYSACGKIFYMPRSFVPRLPDLERDKRGTRLGNPGFSRSPQGRFSEKKGIYSDWKLPANINILLEKKQ